MKKASGIRHYLLFLLAAFALNAVLPFFAVYDASSSHVEKSAFSVFGEKMLICTGDGFKWVKLADLQSGKEKPKPHSGDKCPLCYAARHMAMEAVAGITLRTFARIEPPVSIAYTPPPTPSYAASSLHVRAPPLPSIV